MHNHTKSLDDIIKKIQNQKKDIQAVISDVKKDAI